mgnify:CR=1 FL=1
MIATGNQQILIRCAKHRNNRKINDHLHNLFLLYLCRTKNARTITVEDRAVAEGDIAVIDFEGFKDGVAFDGGKGEDFPLTLGSHQFIPGFEEQVVGHKTGEEFDIERKYTNKLKINIQIEEKQKKLIITVPEGISEQEIKVNVDKGIKKLLKKNTELLIAQRVPHWSDITGFDYNQVKVRDATTRYGSCMPSKKNLYFSSRLIMLPLDKIDAIIVHELCHIKHKNHNKEFYDLVAKYIPDYKEIDKWLKINGKLILF